MDRRLLVLLQLLLLHLQRAKPRPLTLLLPLSQGVLRGLPHSRGVLRLQRV